MNDQNLNDPEKVAREKINERLDVYREIYSKYQYNENFDYDRLWDNDIHHLFKGWTDVEEYLRETEKEDWIDSLIEIQKKNTLKAEEIEQDISYLLSEKGNEEDTLETVESMKSEIPPFAEDFFVEVHMDEILGRQEYALNLLKDFWYKEVESILKRGRHFDDDAMKYIKDKYKADFLKKAKKLANEIEIEDEPKSKIAPDNFKDKNSDGLVR